jgi:hypothetical protein
VRLRLAGADLGREALLALGVSGVLSKSADPLARVKRVLEVLAILVGLIGAILALFGWSRK